jgi:beta propeller repeat protein
MRSLHSILETGLIRARAFASVALVTLAFAASLSNVSAQQQFQGVCSGVKIVIQQELTLERIGFEATLEVGNNDGDNPITDFYAALTFENPAMSTNGVVNDASSLFFVQAPTFESVNSVGGDGVIAPGTKGIVKWFIIPKISAGGTSPDGVRYKIGCQLSGKMQGVTIPSDVMAAIPATIYVKPEPQLDITYFQPRDVQGDDPFTTSVESPVPFTIGVLVKNSGYGIAKSVKINSQQPKIVENKNNLLLIAQLLTARVGDQAVSPASLLVDLGDIQPGQTRKGSWDMITTLSGEFVEFRASYTHASELGGTETSVIKSLNAYFISHEVMNDQPGRDSLKDFLAITDNNANLIPTALYESEGNVLPVNYLTNVTVSGSASPGGAFTVRLKADKASWGYMRMADPGQAKLPIASVVRSDGKVLNPNNYWTNIRYTEVGNVKQTFLNLFDLVDLNDYEYTVTYGGTTSDVTAPVTTLRFTGFHAESGGVDYITPDTQMYFLSEDASPVSIVYSVTNSAFRPALPFQLTTPGTYPVVFYATDSSGNREANKTNILVVSGVDSLTFASLTNSASSLFVSGGALSVRPSTLDFSFQAAPDPSQVDATLNIYQGVIGWASVSGVPSSPTAATGASLTVGGDYVDFYRYSLNGGAWSAESSATTPLVLKNLPAGLCTVKVLGRSQYGYYQDATNAVTVRWVVDPASPPARVTGAPATPTRDRTASLTIAGDGVSAYRWTLNNSYYRVESNAPAVLPLTISSSGAQTNVLSIIGKSGGAWQQTNNPTTVTWVFDPLFAYSQGTLARVRTLTVTNIGTQVRHLTWDGLNDSGTAAAAGWYTARLTLVDQLGRTNFATRLIQLGAVAGAPTAVADATRGPKNPSVRGRWVVWQDQSSGNYEIYARDTRGTSSVVKVTSTVLNQENPRTDGHYVVWQGRQSAGNWCIYISDLASNGAPQQVTFGSTADQINPVIEWPWVVYQWRPVSKQNASWQLRALNLLTGHSVPVWTSTADQLDPDIQKGRVVWQDWRDVGPGEIYFKNLETGEQRRITTNTFGQYHPVIGDNWIVWQDNRDGEADLYGFDLSRNTELRLTNTRENEARPFIDGPWVACVEDTLGVLTGNLRLVHLPSLAVIPVTRSSSLKERPAITGGQAFWLDTTNSLSSVQAVDLPVLQGVLNNRNAVAVTPGMAGYLNDAYTLLAQWNAQAQVLEVTHYTSLSPSVVSETAFWTNGVAAGVNFKLSTGDFLWMRFVGANVLDLGSDASGAISLAQGANVVSYTGFPGGYSAYKFLNQVGIGSALSVRMLDPQTGRWLVAQFQDGHPVGVDFNIPRVAVLVVEMATSVNNFKPE